MRGNASPKRDVIVIGGGHNGLTCAAFLAKAGLRVLVVEARDRLGGPCGTFEFLPGYRCAFSNSPGSLEPRIVHELELEAFGLEFVRSDPTVIHHFPDRCFVGWRDPAKVAAQLDALAAGEAERFAGLLTSLEEFARKLGVSVFEPCPGLEAIERRARATGTRALYEKIFVRSLRELLEEHLETTQARAILTMLALNTNMTTPSSPGTSVGLMLRPLSLASDPSSNRDDFRRIPLRGSTGLPIGGMGAIVDALETCGKRHGVEYRKATRVERITHAGGHVTGVVADDGEEIEAPIVVSAINPRTLFERLVDDAAVGAKIRQEIAALPMNGSAFKMVLALDGLPRHADLPDEVASREVAGCQFRVARSIDYVEHSIRESQRGEPSCLPIMWGLIPSVTSPGLAPRGKHLMSVNIWHAPYHLREGDWSEERARFGERCIDVLSDLFPDLRERIVDARFMSPRDCEQELGIVEANITHGEMLAERLFGPRPHRDANDYRTPLPGLYLSGGGVWPGGYVTGIPGFNTSRVVLSDWRARGARRRVRIATLMHVHASRGPEGRGESGVDDASA